MKYLSTKGLLLMMLISGIFLNVSFFYNSTIASIFAFFSIAPALYALAKLENTKRYLGGVIFFGAWLLPTNYWYFHFMPFWLALVASSYFLLIANVFQISRIIKKRSVLLDFFIVIVSWIGLTFLRTSLPITQDWWITDIFYTQWQNIFVMQIAYYLGVYGIMMVILLSNAIIAYLWLKERFRVSAIFGVTLIAIFLVGNHEMNKMKDVPIGQDMQIIALQNPESDIEKLKLQSIEALKKGRRETTILVWPENKLHISYSDSLKAFVKNQNIFLVYNTIETASNFNTTIMLDPNGKEILRNYKTHKAPGENIQVPKNNFQDQVKISGLTITNAICYDLHYFDLALKLKNTDILLASVNDADFGRFMPYLHAKDIILRAIENRVNIGVSSTTGPTMFVDRNGIIRAGPLIIYGTGTLKIYH